MRKREFFFTYKTVYWSVVMNNVHICSGHPISNWAPTSHPGSTIPKTIFTPSLPSRARFRCISNYGVLNGRSSPAAAAVIYLDILNFFSPRTSRQFGRLCRHQNRYTCNGALYLSVWEIIGPQNNNACLSNIYVYK